MKNKRICVVGGGNWGKNHINTLNQLNCLAGVVDKEDNQLRTFKENYPNIQIYNRVEDAQDDNFDGYVVATNAQSHFEIAKFLIENNQHVLVEKP
ncbi:MAG: Gfo/Idh/MocA family oxidoreductase, partial [Candidatus Neomarinimicrobiota bacterium]